MDNWTVNEYIQMLLAVAAVLCGALGQWNRIRIGQLELQLQKKEPAGEE